MKNEVAFILGLIVFVSCIKRQEETKESSLKYFYIRNVRGLQDTLFEKYPYKHEKNDSLISLQTYSYRGQTHVIKMYSNYSDNISIVDNGEVKFELDSLGVIYSRSTTWPNYKRLFSNNDSLNSIIISALENIILHPSMRCYNCNIEYVDKTIKFIPPTKDR